MVSLFDTVQAEPEPARPAPPVALFVEPIGDGRFVLGRRSTQAFGCVYLTRGELAEIVRLAGEVLR